MSKAKKAIKGSFVTEQAMPKKEQTTLFTTPRLIFYALSVMVFSLAVYYMSNLRNIDKLLFKMDTLWLILAFLFQIITYLLNALILHFFLQDKAKSIGLLVLFKMSIVIMFVNQVLPTGGISGNGYVFNQLVNRKVDVSNAFNILVTQTICYYIAILTLLGSFYGWYCLHLSHINPIITYTTIGGFIFFIVLGIMVFLIGNNNILSRVPDKFKWLRKLKPYLSNLGLPSLPVTHKNAFKTFIKDRCLLIGGIMLQICIVLCDILTVFAIIRGFNLSLPFSSIALGLLLSVVVGSLPISPGALIAYESAMTFFLATLGVPVHAALIVTLIFRFLTFWLPIPIGLFMFRNLQIVAHKNVSEE